MIAVFLPLTFLTDTTGRLFREFGVTVAAAVAISGFVALTLSPALCARVLRPAGVAFLSTPNALTHRGPRNPFHTQEFTPKELEGLLGRHFSFVFLAGQRRPVEVYHLEQACRRVRSWDVLGLKRLLPRPLISLIVSLIARMNGLPPPQRMGFRSFPISEDTTHAYSLFALCGHAPYHELASQLAGGS